MWYKDEAKRRILFIDEPFYQTNDKRGTEVLIEDIDPTNLETLGYELLDQPVKTSTHFVRFNFEENSWTYEKDEQSHVLQEYRKRRNALLNETDKLIVESETLPQSLKEYRDFLKSSTENPNLPELIRYNSWIVETMDPNLNSNTALTVAEIENE